MSSRAVFCRSASAGSPGCSPPDRSTFARLLAILLGRSCDGFREEQPRSEESSFGRPPAGPIRAPHDEGPFFVTAQEGEAARPATPPKWSLKTEQRATKGASPSLLEPDPRPSCTGWGLITPSCLSP